MTAPTEGLGEVSPMLLRAASRARSRNGLSVSRSDMVRSESVVAKSVRSATFFWGAKIRTNSLQARPPRRHFAPWAATDRRQAGGVGVRGLGLITYAAPPAF